MNKIIIKKIWKIYGNYIEDIYVQNRFGFSTSDFDELSWSIILNFKYFI